MSVRSTAVTIAHIIMEMPCDEQKILKLVHELVQSGTSRPGSPVSQTNWQLVKTLLEINRQLEIQEKRGEKAPKQITHEEDIDQIT